MVPCERARPELSEHVWQRGWGVFKAELRPAEVDPRLKKNEKNGCAVKAMHKD